MMNFTCQSKRMIKIVLSLSLMVASPIFADDEAMISPASSMPVPQAPTAIAGETTVSSADPTNTFSNQEFVDADSEGDQEPAKLTVIPAAEVEANARAAAAAQTSPEQQELKPLMNLAQATRTAIQTPQALETAQNTQAQATSESTPPPPSSPPAAQPETPPQQMSLNQFQQWLQSNGYAQNTKGNKAPTGSSPIAVAKKNPPPALNGPMPRPAPVTIKRIEPVASCDPPRPLRRQRVMIRPLTFEEQQRAMVHSVPKSPIPQPAESSAAFRAMLQSNMPLSPQQVVRLRQQIDLSQRAAAVPANIPPKPISTTLMINLAPGTTPPAVRLAQGYVSSLVFVDSTGAPWPIAAFDVGNPKAVNIQWDGKTNILLLQAVTPYSNGDIVIRLVGLPTPITLEIVSGQRVVDYRVDIHVSGLGPNSKDIPMGTALPDSANQLLLGVLDGVGPAGSRALMVRGADSQAWQLGEKMYLRTRLTLLSPGWIGTMVSPDGMHAYELPKTSSVLVSRYGEPVELRIEGF